MSLKKKLRIQNQEVMGGYTTFYRAQSEPCRVDAGAADIRTMELLGFSAFNPLYLIEKVKQLYSTYRNNNK